MEIIYAKKFESAIRYWKKKDGRVFRSIESQIEKIIREPEIGKPLRHALKSRRRLHVGSFVLVYEFHNNDLRFIDFDHHDRIYKK
ncbi:MAG: type II toxin-antitoxin system RelE/ParE family toxin [Candidatus Sungbacteria bacterium]|uniref:Type II toxin-antitoxin system RelE/ParE family toxin n=1 Tax=Candidatus Sungiibacteriota bacterium TaxID=2750080 RepID=A0A9D6LPH8_9BACT|nr:type II toxin-antitoxin system RelE/ParE family toxin [Candidatus Sungbacteria bacterium]